MRTDLAFDGQNLWQIAGHPKKIVVIDPEHEEKIREIPLGTDQEHACGLCIKGDKYWGAYEHLGLIVEHAREPEKTLSKYRTLPRVAGIEIVGHNLWYAEYEKSLLVEIDLSTGKESERYSIPGNPTGLTWDGVRFWYSDFANGVISAVRPR